MDYLNYRNVVTLIVVADENLMDQLALKNIYDNDKDSMDQAIGIWKNHTNILLKT